MNEYIFVINDKHVVKVKMNIEEIKKDLEVEFGEDEDAALFNAVYTKAIQKFYKRKYHVLRNGNTRVFNVVNHKCEYVSQVVINSTYNYDVIYRYESKEDKIEIMNNLSVIFTKKKEIK